MPRAFDRFVHNCETTFSQNLSGTGTNIIGSVDISTATEQRMNQIHCRRRLHATRRQMTRSQSALALRMHICASREE